MIVRYRYRAYPTPSQVQNLARSFGCARVVFNDSIRVRDEACVRGEKISDGEVQRRVVTLAKRTEQRAWLSEVASVVLTQACQDSRRAYRNFFDSFTGKHKGRKVGRPKFKSRKDNRQSVSFTRGGFRVTSCGVKLSKIGDVKLVWSRELPSVPSSLRVIKEADGRYYVSFVVEFLETPLPVVSTDVGLDLGLTHLITDSNGNKELNPRYLRVKARKVVRLQRALCRKQKGSANRTKARVKLAIAHRKVRETRLDSHHKLALRLIRDNQAIYVEDLAVSGLARTRLAKSINDVGWSIFIRLLGEKAVRYGRQVVKINRWFPSSQLCSECGSNSGPKPLNIRQWTCSECDTEHDRDVNAAYNILIEGRKVAVGLTDTLNACGDDVRRERALAVA